MKPQAKKFVATEKRILTPSGRLQQVAALVYRYHFGELQILVITSRGTGRWIIPKGWPQIGRTLAQTAAREAYEEAGVRGEVSPHPIGSFDYSKNDLPRECINHFTVAVYALLCVERAKDWPEREQRICEWVSPSQAAKRVDEDDLKDILLNFTGLPTAIAAE
ncbi:NUDIX hydrolase [Brucella gallinifaecis]|uniref:NUDIX hydrolase n=1 Tax=Brucella gallinifaecis TaxID=215590 RepID=A0A502BS55_9HYPH|nr:NUDIX hydrolase [Brucella gallinifaecis]TPF75833.1 NUDIX hydrolase [Brucella gallinifaecis]